MFTKFRNPYTEDKVFNIQKGFINILHDICELNEIPDTISEICETVISDIGKQTSFTDSIINAHNAFYDGEYTAMLNREYHLQEIQRANRVISLVAEGSFAEVIDTLYEYPAITTSTLSIRIQGPYADDFIIRDATSSAALDALNILQLITFYRL